MWYVNKCVYVLSADTTIVSRGSSSYLLSFEGETGFHVWCLPFEAFSLLVTWTWDMG